MKVPSQFPWIVAFVLIAHAVVGLFILGGTASREQDHEGHDHGEAKAAPAKKKHPLEGVAFKAPQPVVEHPFAARNAATSKEKLDSLPKKEGGGYTAEDNQVFTSRFPRAFPTPKLEEPPKEELASVEGETPTATPRVDAVKPITVIAEKPSDYRPIKPIVKKQDEGKASTPEKPVKKVTVNKIKQPEPVTRPRINESKTDTSELPRVRKIRAIKPVQ